LDPPPHLHQEPQIPNDDGGLPVPRVQNYPFHKALKAGVVAAALWLNLPGLVAVVDVQDPSVAGTAALPTHETIVDRHPHRRVVVQTHRAAFAKEMASGSGSRVNKDAESLLRYGLPIQNKEVRTLVVGYVDE
jgi:hypothetical protein